jgi:hypothetical protein
MLNVPNSNVVANASRRCVSASLEELHRIFSREVLTNGCSVLVPLIDVVLLSPIGRSTLTTGPACFELAIHV